MTEMQKAEQRIAVSDIARGCVYDQIALFPEGLDLITLMTAIEQALHRSGCKQLSNAQRAAVRTAADILIERAKENA